MHGCSTLLITYRLVGMEWLDEILVLRVGKIIERDNHTELLVRDGLYHQMWKLQHQQLV